MPKKSKTSSDIPVRDQFSDELVRCVLFALNHLKSNGGLVMRKTQGAEYEFEAFETWFARALEPYGYRIDKELLAYQRASKANRKRMEQDPAFAAKLKAHREKDAAP